MTNEDTNQNDHVSSLLKAKYDYIEIGKAIERVTNELPSSWSIFFELIGDNKSISVILQSKHTRENNICSIPSLAICINRLIDNAIARSKQEITNELLLDSTTMLRLLRELATDGVKIIPRDFERCQTSAQWLRCCEDLGKTMLEIRDILEKHKDIQTDT